MGVAGVAWATFAAQGAAGVAAFFVLLRRVGKIQSDTPEKPKIFSSDALKQISRISVPSILQSSFVSVGNLFVQSLVNSFGSSVIGGYASAIKLNTFAITCFSTLSNSVSSFCAQNIGADKTDRIKTGVKSGMLMLSCCSDTFCSVLPAFRRNACKPVCDTGKCGDYSNRQ